MAPDSLSWVPSIMIISGFMLSIHVPTNFFLAPLYPKVLQPVKSIVMPIISNEHSKRDTVHSSPIAVTDSVHLETISFPSGPGMVSVPSHSPTPFNTTSC